MRDFIKVTWRYFIGWLMNSFIPFILGNGEYQYHYFPFRPTQSLWPVFVAKWNGLRRTFIGLSIVADHGVFTALVGCGLFSIGIRKSIKIASWEKYHVAD